MPRHGGDAPADRNADALVVDARAARRLRRARRIARFLDDAVELPVVHYCVGLDAVAGLVPVAGDALGSLLALVIVWEAYRLRVSRRTLAGMLLFVAVDFAVGSVPVVGDVLDATLKANRRNVRALERDLASRGRTRRSRR